MFNRKLQVDVVKAKRSAPVAAESGPTFEEKAIIVTASTERVVKKIGYAVCAYVVLDTLRKVAVAYTTVV
jgi:hypothetical protein